MERRLQMVAVSCMMGSFIICTFNKIKGCMMSWELA
jgi:hypothetical protein